jgi:hypothetical protein
VGGGEGGEGVGVAVEFVGGVEVLDGGFDVAELEEGFGVVVEAGDVLGLEGEGVAPTFEGGSELLELEKGAAGAVPGGEVAGGELEGFVEGSEGVFRALLGQENVAVEAVEFRGGGVNPESGPAGAFRFGKALGEEVVPGGFERGHAHPG